MRTTIALLMAGLIFASCSQQIFTKRKYTKGIYLARHQKPSEPLMRETRKQFLLTTQTEEEVLVQVIPPPEKRSGTSTHLRQKEQATASPNASGVAKHFSAPQMTRKEIRPLESADLQRREFQSLAKGGGSVAPIVLIILCIFIPPLAVYLFQSAVKNDFWLDLVLTLLGWLPGIIYAFLVCFAGVSIN
jgi:uncharacterized membrane protein YqaE (UPF0057 family)